MLKIEVVEPNGTIWGAPIDFAPKRLHCVLCALLGVKCRDKCNSYSILVTDYCIDLLGEALIFSISDSTRAYWHVKFEVAYYNKPAFTSHHGL